MSSCKVDIDDFYWDPMGSYVFYKSKIVKKSRKIHVCTECESEIPIGSSYELAEDKIDNSFVTFKTCEACLCARKHFLGGTHVHEDLWEMIFDSCSADSIPEDCLLLMSKKFRDRVFKIIEDEWEDEELNNE